eukprot:14277517-Alexandrium_andersonii.AAC.1
MSASLVGSEMCIRDRAPFHSRAFPFVHGRTSLRARLLFPVSCNGGVGRAASRGKCRRMRPQTGGYWVHAAHGGALQNHGAKGMSTCRTQGTDCKTTLCRNPAW